MPDAITENLALVLAGIHRDLAALEADIASTQQKTISVDRDQKIMAQLKKVSDLSLYVSNTISPQGFASEIYTDITKKLGILAVILLKLAGSKQFTQLVIISRSFDKEHSISEDIVEQVENVISQTREFVSTMATIAVNPVSTISKPALTNSVSADAYLAAAMTVTVLLRTLVLKRQKEALNLK